MGQLDLKETNSRFSYIPGLSRSVDLSHSLQIRGIRVKKKETKKFQKEAELKIHVFLIFNIGFLSYNSLTGNLIFKYKLL